MDLGQGVWPGNLSVECLMGPSLLMRYLLCWAVRCTSSNSKTVVFQCLEG
jgi:hypothetical protein